MTYIRPETKLPPVWIMHGTKDRKVSPYQSVRLYKKLKECGKEATLYLVDGADHGGSEFWTPEAVDAGRPFHERNHSTAQEPEIIITILASTPYGI